MEIAVLILLLYPQAAFAYLDLGTGSYLFQVGLATFLLVVYSVRTFIKNMFQVMYKKIAALVKRD